ncbi:MAG: hypothetical protein C0597_09195 [Marinilabiliales bacterium]|nr:MAG: hypothetical protein C0597_09195 [Marinilabiliales bacterium]
MKAATVKEIKEELKTRSPLEMLEICLRLARFKKENKELLTYLLFEYDNEFGYIESVKRDMDEQFNQINRKNYFYIRKSIRKILTATKKFIRYSQKKETEVELLIYFCSKMKNFKPSIHRSPALQNLFIRQIELIKKTISQLHEDLQFDYNQEMESLTK